MEYSTSHCEDLGEYTISQLEDLVDDFEESHPGKEEMAEVYTPLATLEASGASSFLLWLKNGKRHADIGKYCDDGGEEEEEGTTDEMLCFWNNY